MAAISIVICNVYQQNSHDLTSCRQSSEFMNQLTSVIVKREV